MADFDEYEYEGKRVKVPKGTEPTEELLDSLSQEQDKIQKRDEHLAKRQDAVDASEISFPRASRALEAVLKPIAWAGERFDRIGGAPTRAAISSIQDGGGIKDAIGAFGSQFGAPSANAPTGKEIALRMGLSSKPTETTQYGIPPYGFGGGQWPNEAVGGGYSAGPTLPSPAGAAGFAIDVLADPTNVIPVGAAAKMAGKGGVKVMGVAAHGASKGIGVAADVTAKGADILTGTKIASGTVNAAKSGLNSLEGGYRAVGDALKSRFGSELSKDFTKSLKVAQDNKIDPDLLPESIMFGPNSSASRMARVKAEGPLGQALLDRHQKGIDAVRDAIKTNIRAIGGEVVKDGKVIQNAKIPPNSFSAGEMIKKAYDDGVDRSFNEIGQTHNKIIQDFPGLPIDPNAWDDLSESMASLEDYATKRAKTGITKTQKEQGVQLLNAIENIKENSKTYSGMVDALRDIGDIAFKSKNVLADIPPDIARFRGLYRDLNQSLIKTVKANEAYIGQNAAADLLASNKKITEMYGDKSLLSALGDEGKSPERLFKGLIIDGDAKRVKALQKYLTPEQFQQVKAAALNTLIKENPQGEFTFRMLHNSMRGKKDVLEAMFAPTELENINNLIELGDKFGPSVMSTSGTGASNSFGRLISAPLDMVEKSADAIAASKQNKAADKAKKFIAGDEPVSRPAKSTRIGKIIKNPRGKASQVYNSTQEENKD